MGPEYTHLLDSLGWAVLHSLWQGGIAFILVVLMRTFWRHSSPALRYAAQMLVLIGCLAAFFATFAMYAGATSPSPLRASSGEGGQLIFGGFITAFDPSAPNSGFAWPDISSFTPYIAVLWFIGFMALSLRYAFSYGQTQQLRVLGVTEAPMEWKLKFLQLLEKTGISKTVKLHISPHIDGPMTMGFLKPVVLVPTGFLTGLPSDQVEAVLLHELAHIRRHDYLLNLIQIGIRTVLFYHPAIHIISRWIDRDREQACDDMAVAKGHNAKALLKGLAAIRLQNQSLALAATGKNEETPLLDRLTRLAGQTPGRPRRPEHVLMSLLSALMIGTIYVGAMGKADAHPHPKPPKLKLDEVAVPDTVVAPTPPKPGQYPGVLVTPGPLKPGAALPPAPPALPALPPLTFTGQIDKGALQSFIETDKAIYKAHKIALNQYKSSLKQFIKEADLDADDREDLWDDYEDYVEDVEDVFADRREAVEDAYHEYEDARHDAQEHWSEKMEARIEREVERAVEQAELDVSLSVKRAQEQAFRKQKEMRTEATLNRERAKEMRRQAELNRKQAMKEAEKARAHALKDKRQKNRHEAFRDAVMSELLADGIIKSPSEKVFLTHFDGKMQVNGNTLPKTLRGKYCEYWEDAGFKDDDTEVTIKPGSLQIFTDKKNGQHTTRVTYGSWKN